MHISKYFSTHIFKYDIYLWKYLFIKNILIFVLLFYIDNELHPTQLLNSYSAESEASSRHERCFRNVRLRESRGVLDVCFPLGFRLHSVGGILRVSFRTQSPPTQCAGHGCRSVCVETASVPFVHSIMVEFIK